MCQVFSHEPLGKMWETCLPRDESALVKYQYESTRIFGKYSKRRRSNVVEKFREVSDTVWICLKGMI